MAKSKAKKGKKNTTSKKATEKAVEAKGRVGRRG